MSARSNLNAAVAATIEALTEETAVTYNGNAVSSVVHQGKHELGSAKKRGEDKGLSVGSIKVLRSEVSAWAYRDVVVYDSVTWHVMRLLKKTPSYFLLEIETDERRGERK